MRSIDLLNLVKIKKVYGKFPKEISNVSIDSRKIEDNSVFIASRGFTVDSHKFIPDVIDKGVKFIVADRYVELDFNRVGLMVVSDTMRVASMFANKIYDYPSLKINTVGVTGTSGKTSVSTMIHELTMNLGSSSAMIGTNGFFINDKSELLINTTPETISLTKQFKSAVDNDVNDLVMEVSSHALSLGRTFGIDFDIAVFTNISHEHLDFYRHIDHYAYTKGMLLSQLGNRLDKTKYMVLNKDDKWCNELKVASPYESVFFSVEEKADFYATDIELRGDGTTFTLHSPEGEFTVESPFIGKFNVENILPAIITMWLKGYEVKDIVDKVPMLKPVDGRVQFVGKDELPITLIVDYALTPDGLSKLIDAVEPMVKKRLILLTAMWGRGRDITKAPIMGEISSRADYVVFTNNHPGDDDRQRLVDELEKGIKHKNYKKFLYRREAIKHAIDVSEPGDVVLLSGRGSEPFMIVEGLKPVPFRDDLIALEYAREKYKR